MNSQSNGGIISNLPNSTKNQITNVQNKFGNRDLSPKNILNNSIGGGQGSMASTTIPSGHQAQIGFQKQIPGHNGRVQSLDVNNSLAMNQNQIVQKQRGGIQGP